MADRVAVMKAGRLEQCAPPADLYDRPASVFVAEFVGTMNHLTAVTQSGGMVRVFDLVVAADGAHRPPDKEVTVLVRPEALVVAPADAGWIVTSSVFRGASTRLRLQRPGERELVADIAAHRTGELPVGATASVALLDRPVLVGS